jgi:hypothetical protein
MLSQYQHTNYIALIYNIETGKICPWSGMLATFILEGRIKKIPL